MSLAEVGPEMLVRQAALRLGEAEKNLAEEVVRLVALGSHHWVAQKQAEVAYAREVAIARAEYEIALADYRRS